MQQSWQPRLSSSNSSSPSSVPSLPPTPSSDIPSSLDNSLYQNHQSFGLAVAAKSSSITSPPPRPIIETDPQRNTFQQPVRTATATSTRPRTAQACEKCRTRKAKCSGDHPSCKRCLTRGLECQYSTEGRGARGRARKVPNSTRVTPEKSSSTQSSPSRIQLHEPLAVSKSRTPSVPGAGTKRPSSSSSTRSVPNLRLQMTTSQADIDSPTSYSEHDLELFFPQPSSASAAFDSMDRSQSLPNRSYGLPSVNPATYSLHYQYPAQDDFYVYQQPSYNQPQYPPHQHDVDLSLGLNPRSLSYSGVSSQPMMPSYSQDGQWSALMYPDAAPREQDPRFGYYS